MNMDSGVKKERDTGQAAQELHSLLAEIARGLETLYESLRSQQKAIVQWDLATLTENIGVQKKLVRAHRAAEERRRALSKEIAGAGRTSLSEVGDRLGGPWPGRFRRLAVRIRESAGKVETMKKQNEFLLEKARGMVNGQLRLFMELARVNRNTYEGSGRKSRQSGLYKVFDQTA